MASDASQEVGIHHTNRYRARPVIAELQEIEGLLRPVTTVYNRQNDIRVFARSLDVLHHLFVQLIALVLQ